MKTIKALMQQYARVHTALREAQARVYSKVKTVVVHAEYSYERYMTSSGRGITGPGTMGWLKATQEEKDEYLAALKRDTSLLRRMAIIDRALLLRAPGAQEKLWNSRRDETARVIRAVRNGKINRMDLGKSYRLSDTEHYRAADILRGWTYKSAAFARAEKQIKTASIKISGGICNDTYCSLL